MSWAITNTRKEMIIRSLLYSQMDVIIKRMAITILNHQEVEAGHVETPLQPDGGDDEEDGEHNDEEVEDEDAGERRGKLVHHQGEPELSNTALIFIFLVNIDTIIVR